MKSIKLTLGIAAFAFGVFSFTPVKVNQATKGQYYVAGSSAGAPVVAPNRCDDDNDVLCSQEYNIVNGQPTTPTGNAALKRNGPFI